MEALDLDNPTDDYPERFTEWIAHNREYNRIRMMWVRCEKINFIPTGCIYRKLVYIKGNFVIYSW